MTPIQNNPMMMLVQAMNSGQNPMPLMQKMAGQNPLIAQTLHLMQGKSPQQLQAMAQNMAREQGADINQIIRSLGINTSCR